MTAEELVVAAEELIAKIKADAKNSFTGTKPTVGQIIKFVMDNVGICVEFAQEATKSISGLGEQKKKFVCDTIRTIYKEANPNLPYIPEPFETMLENFLLNHVVPVMIDWIVAKYKEKGIFKTVAA